MSLELKLDLRQITRISSHDDDPDEYFRTHYKHSSTIGGEKVEYAFASRAALLRWGDNEWGFASQGDVVIVSKHLQPELVPFVALHLLYTSLDNSELEDRLGLERGDFAKLDYYSKDKAKLSIPIAIAAQYLSPDRIIALLDLYRDSEWSEYLDQEILGNLISVYNPEGQDTNALITREGIERDFAVKSISRKVTAHRYNKYVRRSRNFAIAAKSDGRVARLFGCDTARADKVLAALDENYLIDGCVALCRIVEQLRNYDGNEPVLVDSEASRFLYEAYVALEPLDAPMGAIRKQRKNQDSRPFRFGQEQELQGIELEAGQNIVILKPSQSRFWESLHLRLQYIVDQQRQELEEAMKGATKLLGDARSKDDLAYSHAQRVVALIGESIVDQKKAMVPLVAQVQDVADSLEEITAETENAIVNANQVDEDYLVAMRAHGMLARLRLSTAEVDNLIRHGRQEKFDRLAAQTRTALAGP